MPSLYSFSEFSNEWASAFSREAELWKTFLGDDLIAVYHFGSTSIPGLAAKPIIDLLVIARAIEAVDAATSRIVAEGYAAWSEYGLAGRRYFPKDRDGVRTHNVHVYAEGNPGIDRHLAFCAYLKEHPELCREYEALKREAYRRFPADIDGYSDFKDAWIKTWEPVALAWWQAQQIKTS